MNLLFHLLIILGGAAIYTTFFYIQTLKKEVKYYREDRDYWRQEVEQRIYAWQRPWAREEDHEPEF